ncbi:unnamed protein product [Rotaria socialis]|uniref:Multifunctional fusion protein n=4 Tax=Rotaria socialis TaxID=392032 RepID=A0A818Q092_9BILA|nr:unnamed protein product [Rotaria socialis]CAF3526436.1 unnamed protein product [Rotaria socialis]CAF3628779.1 unnamed protein product [Rotaria socialis]CAF3712874.1 unnamed protein product [Rotaria socialis]CAF4183657.1 unnamed protein product [Rotaria socialis]
MYRLCVRRCASTFSLRYTTINEPILEYRRNSNEIQQVQKILEEYQLKVTRIPCIIDGKEFWTNDIQKQVLPFDHQHVLAEYCYADKSIIQKAIDRAAKNQATWNAIPIEQRANIFLKAADLAADLKWRSRLVASTMLGQGKTVFQAEIDAACELIDFWRFNVQHMAAAMAYQPTSTQDSDNSYGYRGLEGFVAAISPFNFTAIGGHLASAPAFMGNTVVWKPSDAAVLSNYIVYKILEEAGLPPGIIQFVPSRGEDFGRTITQSQDLAAITFTGSTKTFKTLWKWVAENIDHYRTFPRLVGECGGKNFHLIHPSADITTIVNGTIRSAFEYSGQKCSACSRVYLPRSLSNEFYSQMKTIMEKQLRIDTPLKFDTFTSAVIDRNSFNRIRMYIDYARKSSSTKIIFGGECNDSVGFYIQPTLIETADPNHKLMQEEIFGPVVTVYVYDDKKYDETVNLVNQTSNYALTGSIFCQDKTILEKTRDRLVNAAGNLYLNDKSTGSVVNQQPFGGARLSGTNDKAGGPHYIFRFSSPLAIKSMKVPLTTFKHVSME